MNLRRFGIGRQLTYTFSLIGVLFVVLAGIAVNATTTLRNHQTAVAKVGALQNAALAAKFQTADFNGWQTAYAFDVARLGPSAANDSADSRKAFLASAQTFKDLSTHLKSMGLTNDEQSLVQQSDSAFEQFMSVDATIASMYRDGSAAHRQQANDLVMGQEIQLFGSISDGMQKLVDDLSKKVAIEQKSSNDAGRQANIAVVAIGFLAIALGALLATYITRRLSSRLRRASNDMNGAATDLGAVSTQLGSSAEEASAQSQMVSVTAEEMSANMVAVSAAIEEMQATVQEIAVNAGRASEVAQHAVGTVNETSARVASLGEASTQIGLVIEVITSIAEQTNLLALNATIEAARAGESGKGFAVVANEVKELAKETAAATEQIRDRVNAIQSETTDTVTSIEQIESIIKTISDMQQSTAAAVEEQTATTAEIARNVNEAAQGADDIARSIASVSEAAQQTSIGASSAGTVARSVKNAAEQVAEVVNGATNRVNVTTSHVQQPRRSYDQAPNRQITDAELSRDFSNS